MDEPGGIAHFEQSGCLSVLHSPDQKPDPSLYFQHKPLENHLCVERETSLNTQALSIKISYLPVSTGSLTTCVPSMAYSRDYLSDCSPNTQSNSFPRFSTREDARTDMHGHSRDTRSHHQRSTNSCGSGPESPLSLITKDCQADTVGASSNSSAEEAGKFSTTRDDRYLQRRLRNNLAAKRSRDNRKRREDTIALRAAYLEKSNVLLQAQILTLKREICSLRGIPFDPSYGGTITEPVFSGLHEQACNQYNQTGLSNNFMPFGTVALTPSASSNLSVSVTCSNPMTLYPSR